MIMLIDQIAAVMIVGGGQTRAQPLASVILLIVEETTMEVFYHWLLLLYSRWKEQRWSCCNEMLEYGGTHLSRFLCCFRDS
jgi:hypothetical protein